MSIFGEFKINGNQLVATETGAQIPLNGDFARDAFRIASFVWFVNALRATRVMRGREPRAKISFFRKKRIFTFILRTGSFSPHRVWRQAQNHLSM